MGFFTNKYPYTDFHEFNADWVLKTLREFDEKLEQYDNYNDRITALESGIIAVNNTLSGINHTITAINARCNSLESAIETTDAKIIALRDLLFDLIDQLNTELESVEALYYSLRAYNDSSNTVIYDRACRYADKVFREYLKLIDDPKTWFVISPITNRPETIQQVINELYEITRWSALTAAQFDNFNFDCDYLDSIGYTCFDFDNFGRFALFLNQNYVTTNDLIEYVKRSELDHYALKTDLNPLATKREIQVYNPMTGVLGSMQQSVNALASFHLCGNNCYILDGLDLTATELDAIGFTAYDFDFKGLVRTCGLYIDPTTGERSELQLILNNIVGLLSMGLTASQFDDMSLDCDTLDSMLIDAYIFDFYGLSAFSEGGYITVLTGISVDQYQNIFVGNYGILHTL